MTRSVVRLASTLVVCLLLTMRVGSAQGVLELQGTVTDDTGAPVPGAVVTARDGQQHARSVTSGADGAYAILGLAPGAYTVSVAIQGFSAVERAVSLRPSGITRLDISVHVAAEQRVEVVGSLEELRRLSGLGAAGLLIGPELLNILPNDSDVMLHVLKELSTSSGRPDQVTVYVDGEPVGVRIPPKATIQSIRISTNSYTSEYADPTAGVVEIITRPASKVYQAEGQVNLSDPMLNARNAFDKEQDSTRTGSFSGYAGGPIIPNRWSLLGYAGRWNRDDRLVVNATIARPGETVASPYLTRLPTPVHTNSRSLRTDVAASPHHILSAELVRFDESARNQSLESGLDLPERATSRDTEERTVRASLNSVLADGTTAQSILRVSRRRVQEAAVSAAPAVIVLDTFSAGGNQAALRRDHETRNILFTDTVGHVAGPHSVRIGLSAEVLEHDEQRLTNLGGTFTFGSVVDSTGAVVATPFERYVRTVGGVPGYRPSFFSIARGAPEIRFSDWYTSWFVQDDWRVAPELTLSLGLRHDMQEQARSQLNFAPRAGLAWTPAGDIRHLVRISGGVFYKRIPPDVTLDTLRYDGTAVRELVVNEPTFFPNIPPTLDSATEGLPTVRVKDPLDAPRSMAVTSSYEWQISRPLFASVSYTYRRGGHLLRTLNINQPDPASGLRPRQDLGPVLEFASTGRSVTNELSVSVRRALSLASVFGTYTLASTRSDTDGPYTVAADSRTLQGEFGRAIDDQRHRVVFGGFVSLPDDWSVNGVFMAGSARRFNITTGRDDDGDLLLNDRPGVGVPGDEGTISTELGDFDLLRTPGQPMIVRNAGAGPSELMLNLGVAKKFRLGGSGTSLGQSGPYLILSISAENILNRVNLTDFNGVVTSPLFGTSNRAMSPRRIELGARVGF